MFMCLFRPLETSRETEKALFAKEFKQRKTYWQHSERRLLVNPYGPENFKLNFVFLTWQKWSAFGNRRIYESPPDRYVPKSSPAILRARTLLFVDRIPIRRFHHLHKILWTPAEPRRAPQSPRRDPHRGLWEPLWEEDFLGEPRRGLCPSDNDLPERWNLGRGKNSLRIFWGYFCLEKLFLFSEVLFKGPAKYAFKTSIKITSRGYFYALRLFFASRGYFF